MSAHLCICPAPRRAELLIVHATPGLWKVRPVFDDPAGEVAWGIAAEVALAASDEEGVPVLHVREVGELA